MSNQKPMDRCKCWKETKIVLIVEHCPSLDMKIREEVDKLIQFTKTTDLEKFGKVYFADVSEVKRSS